MTSTRIVDRRLSMTMSTLLAFAIALIGCISQARADNAGLGMLLGGSALAGLLYHVQQPVGDHHPGYATLPPQPAAAPIVIGKGPAMIYHSVAPSAWMTPAASYSPASITHMPESISIVSVR
ncbi:MAG: hypothetical protein HQL58_04745 [Magnetococcales bacterium]|nr:hypothetical protein [Magnetococcales bacterium]